MKTLFKILFYLIIIVVVLFIGAVGLVYLYFDPNDYKEQMATAVKEQTGRELNMGGEIGLSLFPWIAVEAADVTLGNAQGFEEPVFAGVDKMRVSIKLLPLLKQQVEMDTVTLHGLQVNLARNAAGKTNWDDLVEAKPEDGKKAAAEDKRGAPPIAALAIGGLDVEDANISWHDAQAGQRYELKDLGLTTGAIELGEPVDLDLAFRVTSQKPPMAADVALGAELMLRLEAQQYDANGLKLTVKASGETLPAKEIEAELTGDVTVDLKAQTAAVKGLELTALGLDATGEVQATRIVDAPAFSGRLALAAFDPRRLMEALGTPPVETADPDVLRTASLETRFAGTTSEVKLDTLKVALDDTTLDGNLSVANFAQPAIRFDLKADAINADRYLPPKPAGGESEQQAAAGTPAKKQQQPPPQAAPLALLRTLDAAGSLRIGELVINNLTVTDILVRLKGKDGVVNLDPVSAELYQGLFKGQLTVDARKDVPRVAVKKTLKGVQAGPLLKDLTGEERITGTAQMNADMTLSGMDPDTVKKTLNGTADFAFLEGAVNGINIGRLIREAKAKLAGKSLPPEEKALKTDFSELKGSIKAANGVVTNDDLSAKSPLLRITGKGKVNLVKEAIDYTLTTTIVGSLQGQGGKDLEELKGVPIPVRVGGTFQDPSFSPALGEVLKSKATQEIKKKAEEKVKEEVGEKLKEKLGGDKGKELLKGLFN